MSLPFDENRWFYYVDRPETNLTACQVRDVKGNLKQGKSKQRLQDVMLVGKVCQELEQAEIDLDESETRICEKNDEIRSIQAQYKERQREFDTYRQITRKHDDERSKQEMFVFDFLKTEHKQVWRQLQSVFHDQFGKILL